MDDGLSRKPAKRKHRGMRLDTIERKAINWLWKPWLQRGALNLLTGDPGVGKTSIMCELAAALSSGRALPGQDALPPMNCWLMTAEDGASDTISWRLFNQGADPKRVWVTDAREALNPEVIREIKREARENQITFLGIDPVQAWMGKEVDAYRANETREWGAPLREMAMELDLALLLARHRRKAQAGENRLYSGMGSIDLTAFARSEISAVRGKDGVTFLQRIKGNVGLTDDLQSGLTYSIESHSDPSNDHGILRWGSKTHDLSGTGSLSRTPAKLTAAKEFLLLFLADGPRAFIDIMTAGSEKGLSQKTLERAKKELGITSTQVAKGKWEWALPSRPCSEPDL